MRRYPAFFIENRMSDKPNFIGTLEAYHNKLIQVGITSIFVALAVGLFLYTSGAQNVTPVKAASQSMSAGDLSVVGQPSLPAATIDTILKSLGSPMSGLGKVVVQASQQTNIDDAFALAVWWTETNDGAAGVGLADRNPGSVRGSVGYPSAFDGYTIYPSYSAAISYWFNMLKNMYVNRGLSTVYSISHRYVGTYSSALWAGKVVALMLKYRGEAPPVPVVVTPGKRVTEPTVYVHATPTPLVYKAQSQESKALTKRTSSMAKQVSTPSSVLTPTYEYVIIFFALLLALAIVVGVLWLDKSRPARNKEGSAGQDQDLQGEDAQGEIMGDEGKQDENAQGEVVQGEGKQEKNAQGGVVQGEGKQDGDLQGEVKPRPYYMRNVHPFRNITLYALQIEKAPNTDDLINTAHEMDTPKTDALGMRAQEMDTGANFRIRRNNFLPSTPVVETAKSGESPGGSNLGRRSTGLLSRYGETLQK